MDQMLDLLLYDIRKKTPTQDIRMMTTVITTEILTQYRKDPRDYEPSGHRFLQRFGASLKDGSEFAVIFHVHDNHWVATTVDVVGKSIEFGDLVALLQAFNPDFLFLHLPSGHLYHDGMDLILDWLKVT
jgi:hypothetical protein